jgi:hypothetical protein
MSTGVPSSPNWSLPSFNPMAANSSRDPPVSNPAGAPARFQIRTGPSYGLPGPTASWRARSRRPAGSHVGLYRIATASGMSRAGAAAGAETEGEPGAAMPSVPRPAPPPGPASSSESTGTANAVSAAAATSPPASDPYRRRVRRAARAGSAARTRSGSTARSACRRNACRSRSSVVPFIAALPWSPPTGRAATGGGSPAPAKSDSVR